MANYFYGMRLRGFAPGCQPKEGLVERRDSDDDRYYDIAVYDRPLTDDETKHYSLSPLYAAEYADNLGENSFSYFETREDAVNEIKGVLRLAYNEYSALYPDCNITWLNPELTEGVESEVYVPDSDCYTRYTLYEPIQRIAGYVKKNKEVTQIGNIFFRFQGVNMYDDADINDLYPYSNSEDEMYSFLVRKKKALDELEELTKGMTLEDAQDFFGKNTTDDNANFYGNFVYVYSKKKNPKCIFYGVRMD